MAKAGYNATITAGGTAVKEIRSIDYQPKVATDDTTSFSATNPGNETSIPTTSAATIKLSGTRNSTDTGQNNLRTAFRNKTTVTIVLDVNGDASETYTGTYWVVGWNTKLDPKKANTLDVDLQLTGAETVV
jgi:Phage tail tube protein